MQSGTKERRLLKNPELELRYAWESYERSMGCLWGSLAIFWSGYKRYKIPYSSQPSPGKTLLPFFRKLDEGKEQTMEALERRDNAHKQLEGFFQTLRQVITHHNENICHPGEEA